MGEAIRIRPVDAPRRERGSRMTARVRGTVGKRVAARTAGARKGS